MIEVIRPAGYGVEQRSLRARDGARERTTTWTPARWEWLQRYGFEKSENSQLWKAADDSFDDRPEALADLAADLEHLLVG